MRRTSRTCCRLPLVATIALLWLASSPAQVITGDGVGAKVSLGSVQDLAVLQTIFADPAVSSCLSAALASGQRCSEVSFARVVLGQRNPVAYLLRARLGTDSRLDVLYLHAGQFPSLQSDRIFLAVQTVPAQPVIRAFLASPADLAFLLDVLASQDPRVERALLSTIAPGSTAWSIQARTVSLMVTRHVLTVVAGMPGAALRSIQLQCDYDATCAPLGTIQVLP